MHGHKKGQQRAGGDVGYMIKLVVHLINVFEKGNEAPLRMNEITTEMR